MGCCKLLLPLPDPKSQAEVSQDGEEGAAPRPVIVRCLETIRSAGIADIVLVLADPYGAAIREVVHHLPVTIAWNPARESDMAASLRMGLPHLHPDTSGVLVFIPDHPLVTTATCRQLFDRHAETPDAILIPTFEGRKGHPVLVPRPILADLETLPTLREVIGAHADRTIFLDTRDEGVCLDMDTPPAYTTLRQRLAAAIAQT